MTPLTLPVSYVRAHGLPGICATTGLPTSKTYARTLYKWHPAFIPLALVSLLLLLIMHFAGDPLTVRIPLEARLRSRRRRLALGGWFAGFGAFVALLWASGSPSPVGSWLSLAGLVAGCLACCVQITRGTLKVKRRGEVIEIFGAHPALVTHVQAHLAALTAPRAGWYPDPSGLPAHRWWDGGRWTEHVTAAG